MKETGIVRRVDDLGRIVIPKEIRRSLRIRENEPMELCIDEDNLVLKKHNSFARCGEIGDLLKAIRTFAQVPVILCGRVQAVGAAGVDKPKYEGLSLSDDFTAIVGKRAFYIHGDDMPKVSIFNGSDICAELAMPISVCDEVAGVLVIPDDGDPVNMDRASICLQFAAKYLETYWGEFQ